MPQSLIAASEYSKLLADIRQEISRGVKNIEELLERQKVLSYWQIGRRINSYLNTQQQPRGAVGSFYQRLSKDIEVNERTLQQCEQFFRFFPSLQHHKSLKWSHYRFLLVEPDADKRRVWMERIKKDNIPADELRLALLPPPKIKEARPGKLLPPVRGKLYTYRLLRAEDIDNFTVPWFVDLGFAACKEAPAHERVLNNKYLYTSEKIKDDYRLKVVNAKAEELFTFRGVLRRVIDGDTLLVAVDQGFSYWNQQRLRLKAIDSPELDTIAGERAKKWVEKELKNVSNLVVKTYKSDQWDRYLVDVFYIPREPNLERVAAEGLWLNGRMLEAGVAKPWTPL